MINLSRILLLVFVLIPSFTFAWEGYNVDVTQRSFANGKEPDHFLPFTDIPGYYYLAYFAEAPSFTDKWSLIVKLDENRAAASIYVLDGFPKYKSDAELAAAIEKSSEDRKASLNLELAEVIYSMWVNSLYETRYPRSASGGFDGTTYIFSTYIRSIGWLGGRTWSPDTDAPPKWMVEVAHLLRQYVSQNKSQKSQSNIKNRIMEIRSKLNNYLEKNGAL